MSSGRGEVCFEVACGHLVRTVTTRKRKTYVQRCSLAAYQAVVWFVQERAGAGVTTDELWAGLDVPNTQASVALEFLKERGCVRTSFRRSFPASEFLYEDAMVEYHALEHGSG